MPNESTKWLYEQFKAKGYNVGKDQEEFDSLMVNNEESRKWAYETAQQLGFNVGKDQEEFDSLVNPTSITEADEQSPITHPAESTMVIPPSGLPMQDFEEEEVPTFERKTRKEKREALRNAKDRQAAQAAAARQAFEDNGTKYQLEAIKKDAQATLDIHDATHGIPTEGAMKHAVPLGLRIIDNIWDYATGLFDKDIRAAYTTKSRAEETEDMIEEAGHADKGWMNRNIGGAFRGMADGATRIGTWDFGVTGIAEGATIADVVKKHEAGEELSASEQDMLDMLGISIAAQSAYGDQLSIGYQVGQSLPESAGFMAQMYLNPASGIAKKAVKKFGTTTAKKVAARAIGDIAEMGVATVTTGAGRVAEDYYNRTNGSFNFDIDDNGMVRYGGREEQEEATSAIFKALGNQFIQNYTEKAGDYFTPIGNFVSDMTSKGMKKVGLNGLVDAMQDIKSSQWSRAVQDFAEKANFNGTFGEYLEEVAGNIMNAAIVGDMNFNSSEDPNSVFNLETNLVTLLSCATMSGTFHAIEAGGTRYQRGKLNNAAHKAETNASQTWGDRWEELRDKIDAATPEDKVTIIQEALEADVTPEQKSSIIDYAYRNTILQEFNSRSKANRDEMSEERKDAESAFDNGYSRVTPQQMNDAKNLYEYHRQRLTEMNGNMIMSMIDANPMSAIEMLRSNDMNWNEEQIQEAFDYLNAKQVYDGMIQRVRDDIDGRIDQSNAMISARTNQSTGMIQGAIMKQDDRKVYVLAGNLVPHTDGTGIDINASDGSIIIRDAETGALEQVSPESILSIEEPQDPYEQQLIAADAIRAQFAQEAANRIDGVASFNPGDTYTLTGENGVQTQVQVVANEMGLVDNGDGTVNVSDGINIFPIAKEIIQQSVDAVNIERVAEFERRRAEERLALDAAAREKSMPKYAMNDEIEWHNDAGETIRGVVEEVSADGILVAIPNEETGMWNSTLFKEDDLNSRISRYNGQEIRQSVVEEISVNDAEIEQINEKIVQNQPEIAQNGAEIEQEEQPTISAYERIPKDEVGNPIYEQAESTDLAWDAILEQTEGDEAMAQTVADGMVADKEASLKKIEKAKAKAGVTITEKIAAEKERKAAVEQAKAVLDIWKKIADTSRRRKSEAEAERRRILAEEAALRKAEEERLAAEQEEAARIEREALNGVPDMADDVPQDARARGYRRVAGHKVDRQQPLSHLQGKEVSVKFSDDVTAKGHVAIIDASVLQPSHIQGMRNPAHFIDEAQPKERNDEASILSARRIAGNIRPEEITSSITAYTGAPTVNSRGEVIQGNNRGDALRLMWESEKEQAAIYKQYLIDHAEEFGLNSSAVAAMKSPVLANMLDVEDDDAITLGQFVAQDTESGGTERIKPKNAVQKMGAEMGVFANMLLSSSDEETSFAGLVDNNGAEVLRWMNQRGYITATQYKSAFDSKGNLTAEAKNDLKGIMYQSIFQGGNTRLEEMFNAMPAKAQRAILATAFRDYDSPNAERMIGEIQNSIRAYYALSQDAAFMAAKNWTEARMAVESWKIQYAMDDVTGESFLPAEKFSNFALHLATMYKGESQGIIQSTFNTLYDLIQGTQEETLFEQPDNTPRTLAQAIYEVLNLEYDGQQRSNVLAGDGSASQPRKQGSDGNLEPRESIESGEQATDDTGRVVSPNVERGRQGEVRHSERRQQDNIQQSKAGEIILSDEVDENGRQFVLNSKGNIEFGEIGKESGLTVAPILLSEGIITNPATNDGYGLVHIEARHGDQIRKAGYSNVVSFIEDVAQNYERIREGNDRAGNQTYMLQITDKHNNTLMVELSGDGTYWNINTAGIFKTSYGTNRRIVYTRHTTDKQPTVTDEASQNAEQSGTQSSSSMNASTPDNTFQTAASKPHGDVSSDGKDSEKSHISKELGQKIEAAEAETDTNPTEKQKEAGNYKKGHVQVGTFNVTIENPKGSIRSGVDANGNKWEVEMHNTYGYIRGTEGVDGDHIDVFLSDNIDSWNGARVFIIDQYNEDGTFDEHKVMLGFNEQDEAETAFLSNYSTDWAEGRRLDCSSALIEDFEKWIASSHRKTKAFADYKTVKNVETSTVTPGTNTGYSIEPAQYTTKRGKVLDMHLVKFERELSKEEQRDAKALAKSLKGWYDNNQGGFMMRSEDDAQQIVDAVMDESGEALADVAPVSLSDARKVSSVDEEFSLISSHAFKELVNENGSTLHIKEIDGAKREVVVDINVPSLGAEHVRISFTDAIEQLKNGVWAEKNQEEGTSSEDNYPEITKNIFANAEKTREHIENAKTEDAKKHKAILESEGYTIGENIVVDEELCILVNVNRYGLPVIYIPKYGQTTSTEWSKIEKQEKKSAEQPKNEGAFGLVSDARMEELKARLRNKLGGQLNIGIDPEILAIGMELTAGHIDRGIKSFADFTKKMIEDLGDVIRPYLKAFYNGARDLPEIMENGLSNEMTPYDEVSSFDVANFGKEHSDPFATADMVVAEQEKIKQADEARDKIINNRNTVRRTENEQKTTDTEAIASEAEAIAGEVERRIETATTEEQLDAVDSVIDNSIENIDSQLETLGVTPAEESDPYSGRVVLTDGREVDIYYVVHVGEQVGAMQFSKPRIEKYYAFHNGQLIDFKPEKIDAAATEALRSPKPEYPYKVGDKVIYTPTRRTGKPTEATIYRIENGRPVLDVGLAPVMYEVADWKELSPIEEPSTDNTPKKKKNKKKSVSSQEEIGNLFADLFGNDSTENQEDEVQLRNGTSSATRERGHQPQSNESLGESAENSPQGINRRGVDRRDTAHSRLDEERSRSVSRLSESEQSIERKNTHNNHSERGANHAPTSVDARIEANIKAIELAQQLIESGEQATEQQMKVLRKFSGWGGLGKAFSDNVYSKRIQDLLGAEAYQEAVMSANSAYYTPAYVVDTLWDIAAQMGFKGGNILEGSAGIGNILGQMPTSISERSDIHAIEIDRTSGGILSLLYPDAKVEVQGFEETRIPNGSVDLAITNVPFVTGLRVNDTTGDKDLSKKFHNIHDFCIAKNVRKLREGGIGIFITSNGTLDNSKKLRDWIVSEGGADFVGAFRMNNKTFGGTGVTSDIIVIRKRVNGRKSANAIDVSTITGERKAEYDTGETKKRKGVEYPVIQQLSMDYNRYFVEHPENMAGVMQFAFEHGETFRPTSKGLYPIKGKNQEEMLADFVTSFKNESEESVTLNESDRSGNDYVADMSADGKKLGEMYVKDGELVIAGAGGYYPLDVNANKVKGHTKVECFNAYAAIKEALAEVLAYQTENETDKGLKPLLAKLNKAYDKFVETYGHFNKNTAIAFLRKDVDYPNVFSLEKYEETADKKGNRIQNFGKTDVFRQRVIEKEKEPAPTNVKDGIIASVFKFGRIDIPYIAGHLNRNTDEIRNEIISSGLGFEDPATRQIEVSYQYLSGNVREKLRQAQDNNEGGRYDGNIKALQEVIPMDIPAHLIDFTLGSSWVEPKLYEDYVKDRTDVEVKFTAVGGTWFMDTPYFVNNEKNRSMGVRSEMFRETIYGHRLIEAAIQNRSLTVSKTQKKWDGSTETITDKEATQACAAKIDEIRQDFKEWARQRMQSDAEMSVVMERIYNDTFNNYVPMSIPADFVPEYFGGASHKFKMRPHQGRAIVRGTMQPLLLAHEVGTGKTFTLISTAMEMRRLGTARKPMIVVQNATVGQFVASAKKLYPNAKILTLEESDRSAEGRKNFYAKIRYNDWDMIVVPQSTFEFIPDSEERQMQFVQDKITEKMAVLEKMQESDPQGNSMITRQAKKEIEDLQTQLADLSDEVSKKRSAAAEKKRAITLQNTEVKALEMLDRRTDDVENFDDMGIDALLVDEAHEYKHLGFATAMQRGVKGVDASYSKKSQGVFLKTQAILEKNNGRNVIFATGTPISNTAAEIWTFMRYLMPADTMMEYGIYYFDDFVRNFGNIQQMLEFTTSGKFKENNRFAGYVNLPELVRIFSSVSDIVRTSEAGEVQDKIPDIEGGKAQDIFLPQTKALRSIMKFVKAQLAEYEQMSGKEKKENSHIPLTMYGIAKSAAVDARLVDSEAEDDTNSKTNEAVRQTLRSLKDTAKYKGTVAIFADNYQNKKSGFNIYDDIREKLIAEGVPANEIVIIRSGMSVKKKLDIFEKVNRGEIRVILGSTFTLGTGVNIQERLHTVIHLDAPNRPMDYTQRNGRILRQGNFHKQWGIPVRVLRFGVEDSLDVTAYQRLKTKGAIADSIMNGKQMMTNSMTNRVLEEEEDVFGDTVAQLSGSEYAMLKNNAEKNVRKYESRRKQWEADQTYIHNAKPKVKEQIAEAEHRAATNRRFLKLVEEAFPGGKYTEITAGKQTFATIEDMAEYFKEHNKKILEAQKQMKEGGSDTQKRELTVVIGGYSFKIVTELSKEMNRSGGQLFSEVHRNMTYTCPELGLENISVREHRLRNAIEDIIENIITGKRYTERAEAAEREAQHLTSELELLSQREGKPFENDEELAQAKAQLAEYSELMKKEMEEKEAKYAEMDKTVEAATDITLSDEAEEEEDEMMRNSDTMYRIRQGAAPKRTGIGYKVFVLKNGELYPPMVANPDGASTPVGVWIDADAAPIAGQSKTGRNQVKAGGKGTQGGSGFLAYRPGWHLGEIPYALQFNRNDENGNRELFPANFVWAEVEYADDVDYQEEAMSYGMNANGKFQHSYAGLPRVPENGSYRYRTNPNPETDPWIITGAMRVKRLLTPSEVDAMVEKAGREPQRRQYGAVTDEQINALNAKIEKANNISPRVLRKRMAERVNELAKALGLDNVRVITDISQISERHRKAKGYFKKSTGQITIIIPNNTSLADVEQTLLHEAVAHYGLRKLFGSHMDTFLDNVFENAEESVRDKIVDLSKKHGWDFRKATEEYLAGLAERTNFEEARKSGWWQRIKDFFSKMLHQLGFANFRGVTLTDNELRYILWRSYENLKEDRNSSLFAEAADITMQHELKVGEYADDVLYRTGNTPRERYDDEVKTFTQKNNVKWNENILNRLKESYQDSMHALDILQKIVAEESGKELSSFENAYQAENRMSSENKSQAEIYERDFYRPLIQAIQDLVERGADYEDIKAYVIAKHGLERNKRMAQDKAEEAYAKYQKEHPKGTKTLQDFIDEYRKSDYSGLTALTGMEDVADAEAEAERMVSIFENEYSTDSLWEKINAATKETLKKSYDCGMMSKETYEKVRDMYEYYVPLRGWNVDVASNEYEYLSSNRLMLSPALKKAEGRSSLADDPLATIGYMAESSIIQGNRNKMKQKFLNMALNHQSELLSVSKQWYVLDNASGEWEARNPVIPEDATGDEVADIIEQHETDMLALEKKGLAKSKRAGLNLSMHITKREGQEHVVRVMRSGEEFCVYVNGNPRAAQAINGLTNPHASESGIAQAGMVVKNWMARAFTSWNPAFVVSNLARDIVWSTTAVAVKEDVAYTKRYIKNVSGALGKFKLPILLKKYQDGTLDDSVEIERYFGEFIRNGGETGFTQLNTVEDFKRDIERFVKDAQGKTSKMRKGANKIFDGIEFLNRSAEDTSRFMVYMTSRQMGRDMSRSIWDAKEITVNFNKKGSGGLGASVMNFAYIFFNATIQSLANFGKLLHNHPKKMMAALATFGASGLVVPLMNAMLMSLFGGDDDDENAYWDLPEWVRRNNIVIWNPFSERGFLTIPLPHELRALYGMGEIAASVMLGKEDAEEGVKKAAIGFTGMLPFDFTGNGGWQSNRGFKDNLINVGVNLTPTVLQPITQYFANTDYFGVPIYKDTDWNQLDPEWTKAYKGTAPWLVDATKWLNDISGGDNVKSGIVDLNPAVIEHFFDSYLGGMGKTINKASKTMQMLWNEDLREWRNVPIISSFYQVPNERNTGSQINREYWNAVDEIEETEHAFNGYKTQIKMGATEYAEKINELMNSEAFKRYALVKGYKNAISKISSNLKYVDSSNREEVETKIMDLKVEMLEKLDSLDMR